MAQLRRVEITNMRGRRDGGRGLYSYAFLNPLKTTGRNKDGTEKTEAQVRQERRDAAAERGVDMANSKLGQALQRADRAKLEKYLSDGHLQHSPGSKLTARQRAYIQNELTRRDLAAAGPGHVALDYKGKPLIMRSEGVARHQDAVAAMRSGNVSLLAGATNGLDKSVAADYRAAQLARVQGMKLSDISFDPRATKGMSADIAKAYGDARSRVMQEALGNIDKDTSFTRPDGWDKMSMGDKFKAYSEHIVATTGSTPIKSYQDEKTEWLNQRKKEEAQRRRDIADTANPPPGGPAGAGASGMSPLNGGRGNVVNADDLTYGTRPGFSGVNGTPYRAGATYAPSRFKIREASERAMYRDQQDRELKQQAADTRAWTTYYLNNRASIEARRRLEAAQNRMETERLKIAERYTNMANHAMREAATIPGTVGDVVQPKPEKKETPTS